MTSTVQDLERFLIETLDDLKLSRSERSTLRSLLDDAELTPHQTALLRNRAFSLARERLSRTNLPPTNTRALLDWTESVMSALYATENTPPAPKLHDDVLFFPNNPEGFQDFLDTLASARRTLDICVFTITDNRITRVITDAHKRGVYVRILSDIDKSYDRGSDIEHLMKLGIDVHRDWTECHMHHKFAIVDHNILINGSFNWTRAASNENHENITFSNSPKLISAFLEEFNRLWDTYADPV